MAAVPWTNDTQDICKSTDYVETGLAPSMRSKQNPKFDGKYALIMDVFDTTRSRTQPEPRLVVNSTASTSEIQRPQYVSRSIYRTIESLTRVSLEMLSVLGKKRV